MTGTKRLTKNDLSWLESGSKSHQAGINLPLRQFELMFPEICRRHGSPRLKFKISWFDKSGDLFATSENEVVWYSSKNELRLLQLASVGLHGVVSVGDIFEIHRSGRTLRILVRDPRRIDL